MEPYLSSINEILHKTYKTTNLHIALIKMKEIGNLDDKNEKDK